MPLMLLGAHDCRAMLRVTMTLFAGTQFCTAFISNECVCLLLLVLLGMLWQVEDGLDHSMQAQRAGSADAHRGASCWG